MSLIVNDERIYGIDKEGGSYHEHPFENPSLHIDSKLMDIEDFIINSLEIPKKLKLVWINEPVTFHHPSRTKLNTPRLCVIVDLRDKELLSFRSSALSHFINIVLNTRPIATVALWHY